MTAVVGCLKGGDITQLCVIPLTIQGEEVQVVSDYMYMGVYLDNKAYWTTNATAIYKRAQGKLYFLRRLRCFEVCSLFYESVVARVTF